MQAPEDPVTPRCKPSEVREHSSAEPLLKQGPRPPAVPESGVIMMADILDVRASTSSSEPDFFALDRSGSSPSKSVGPAVQAGPFCSCARPEAAALAASAYHSTWGWTQGTQLPVVYHDRYNITFWGLEKLSLFDSFKFQKVLKALTERGYLTPDVLLTPVEATNDMLRGVHSDEYLTKISTHNWKVMQVCEVNSLLMVPPPLLQWQLVYPLRLMAAGTVLAAGVALQRGWAINLGGGMHHAHFADGAGWCAFNDITLAIHRLREATQGRVQRVLYVDLDAHQGNGVALNKQHFSDSDLYIVDMYNSWIYPHDTEAKAAIDVAVELSPQTKDPEYLERLQQALAQAGTEAQPDLIMYNAGADVLAGDSTGRLSLSQEGLTRRDEMVFEFALLQRVPICMTLAGGYTTASAPAVAASIANLFDKFGMRL